MSDLGLKGLAFVEFTSPDANKLENLFFNMGFSKISKHRNKDIYLYQQQNIVFLLNQETDGHAYEFRLKHGPSICSIGFKVRNSKNALIQTVEKGAQAGSGDYLAPSIHGIGNSLIYLVDDYQQNIFLEFLPLPQPQMMPSKGFISIDHLTNNVENGTLKQWGDFYKNIFGFSEVRYFDIRGRKTGLKSYALKSPCQTFCIPINEGTEKKSQINEYLEEYKGPGIQHIAFLTENICSTLDRLDIDTLNIDDEYYSDIFNKVPNVGEDPEVLRKKNILIDGDEKGYLLQIFTKNLVGPIFFEIIQRKNHDSFGEGNFSALFRSIEKDQQFRGYLDGP